MRGGTIIKSWREPEINIYGIKLDENIASSSAAEVTDWVWYIDGNSKPHKGGRYVEQKYVNRVCGCKV